jgi:4-diphosphocytidyl-2-C-methyl-D-erythritol kinase
MQTTEPAPAKVNLALHVRGTLPDGRHRLETVFAFCTDGDLVAADPADELTLAVKGPFAADLGPVEDNLALRAARALQQEAGESKGAALTLTKNPVLAEALRTLPRRSACSRDCGALTRPTRRLSPPAWVPMCRRACSA